MKVLVATSITQGRRANDFNFCEDGEPVRRGSKCSRGSADDNCGCRRSLVGIESSKGTTTAIVVERSAYSEDLLSAEIESAFRREGWYAGQQRERRAAAREEAMFMAELASRFPLGAVIEYRDDLPSVRSAPD